MKRTKWVISVLTLLIFAVTFWASAPSKPAASSTVKTNPSVVPASQNQDIKELKTGSQP